METHAVPQNIMGVEFKLFGNFLSMREFIYIAVSVAISYLLYFLMGNGILPGILAWPLILVVGIGGIVSALVPIQDKTLDKWVLNYIAAIRNPTRRVWRKRGFDPQQMTQAQFTPTADVTQKHHVVTPPQKSSGQKIKAAPIQNPKQETLEKQEAQELERISQVMETVDQKPTSGNTPAGNPGDPGSQTPAAPAPAQPAPQPQSQQQQPQSSAQAPQNNQQPAQQPVPKQPAPQNEPQTQPEPPQQQSQPKQEASQQQTQQQTQQPAQPQSSGLSEINLDDNNIQDYATKIPGVDPLPNTINLVVKDKDGQIIPQTVCVVKNTVGNPVRASVSNNLGHIMNNIQLPDGTYKVELSKQGYTFPQVTMTLTGNVYPPVEIRSL